LGGDRKERLADCTEHVQDQRLSSWTVFAHLVLEKLCKAHWVRDNVSNTPPKIHNLITLLGQTKLQLSEEERAFLFDMNQFQLEGRYPDYRNEIYKKYKAIQTKQVLSRLDTLRKCLLKKLS